MSGNMPGSQTAASASQTTNPPPAASADITTVVENPMRGKRRFSIPRLFDNRPIGKAKSTDQAVVGLEMGALHAPSPLTPTPRSPKGSRVAPSPPPSGATDQHIITADVFRHLPPRGAFTAGAGAGSTADPAPQGAPTTKRRGSRIRAITTAATVSHDSSPAQQQDEDRRILAGNSRLQYVVVYKKPQKTHTQRAWGEAAVAGKGSTQLTPVVIASEDRPQAKTYAVAWATTNSGTTLLLLSGEWPQDPEAPASPHHIMAIPSVDIVSIQEVVRSLSSSPMASAAVSAAAPAAAAAAAPAPATRPRARALVTRTDKSLPQPKLTDAPALPWGTAHVNGADTRGTSPDPEAPPEKKDDAIDLSNITFRHVETPNQVAKKNKTAGLYGALCGTKKRKAASITALIILIGIVLIILYKIGKLMPTNCRNNLQLQPYPDTELYAVVNGLMKFLFAPVAINSTGVVMATACGAALTAQAFARNGGSVSVNIPGASGYPAIREAFKTSEASVTQNSLGLNLTQARNFTCGTSRTGQVQVQLLLDEAPLSAGLPVRFNGNAAPYAFRLPESRLLAPADSASAFQPFEGFELEALHPESAARPTLVLPTQQPNLSFTNLATMRSLLEQDADIDFSVRGNNWFITGSPEDLKHYVGQFQAQMQGDTAIPGTLTQDSIQLGIIDPCLKISDLTGPDHIPQLRMHEIRVSYAAYETPLTLSDACNTAISVTTGVGYQPFSCLSFVSGSMYGNYQIQISHILSGGGQVYPDAVIPLNSQGSFGDWIFQGNLSAISMVLQHHELIQQNYVPSGLTSLSRTGANITDMHTGASQLTQARQVIVTNPARPYSHQGPSAVTLTPGITSRAFSDQNLLGNLWDLMQMQVTASTKGLTCPPDPKAIPLNNGFICIATMPYCDSYFRQGCQFSLPTGPSGTFSYSDTTTTEKGLPSGLASSHSIHISGCNPVVLPSLVFTRTPGVLINPEKIYPFQELGFETELLDGKDALRTDLTGFVKIFDISTNTSWAEYNTTGTPSVVRAFFNGTEIVIPSDWAAGAITEFNITACTGFNASDCLGTPIADHCESRVITHQVTDFPARLDTPMGTAFSRAPGTSLIFGDVFLPSDQNLNQAHNGSVGCVLIQSPEGVGKFAFTFANVSFTGNQSMARTALALHGVLVPDYGPGDNPGFLPSRLTCLGKYGKAEAEITIDRI